jgi:hypothetical protein
VRARPSVGVQMCQRVTESPATVLHELLPIALSVLADTRPADAIRLANELLTLHDTVITWRVAEAFGFVRGNREDLIDGEVDLLRSLVRYDDPLVRQVGVTAAQALPERHKALALELVTSVRFDDSPPVAEAAAAAFGQPPRTLSWGDLIDRQAADFLDQLRRCPSLDEYNVAALLAEITNAQPDAVLALFMNRIELYEVGERCRVSYAPLPAMWLVPLGFTAHERYPTFLRTVRDWISSGSTSPLRTHFGADLFTAVAAEFNEQVIAILLESVDSGDTAHVATAGAILRRAPLRLVWDADFVRTILAAAARHGDECLRIIRAGLERAALTRSAGGFGGPFPNAAGRLGKATEITASLPPGSPEEDFYRSLANWKAPRTLWADSADEIPPDTRDW